MLKAEQIIQLLNLFPHPEGGYYNETYRSSETFEGINDQFPSGRNFSTAIYFLLIKNKFSAFHRIRSDEIWHFYSGNPLRIIEIDTAGKLIETMVGSYIEKGEVFQHKVKAGHWFASEVANGGEYSLAGCTVAPGFDFRDFEMGKKEDLTKLYPDLESIISKYTRS